MKKEIQEEEGTSIQNEMPQTLLNVAVKNSCVFE